MENVDEFTRWREEIDGEGSPSGCAYARERGNIYLNSDSITSGGSGDGEKIYI